MCQPHYMRWWRYGDANAGKLATTNAGKCAVEGCHRQPTSTVAGAFCQMHYSRQYRNGGLDSKIKMDRTTHCAWCGNELPERVSKGNNCGGTCRNRLDYERVKYRIATDPIYRAKWHASNHRQRLLRQERTATVDDVDPVAIFQRDKWTCQICHRPVDRAKRWPDPLSKSLDHIVPLSRGGPHTSENTRLAHLGCNCSKQDWHLSPEDFDRLAERLAAPVRLLLEGMGQGVDEKDKA